MEGMLVSIPKRQHWVPRFYLKYFKVPDTSNREQGWIFHCNEGEPHLTSINNIAAKRHLYSPITSDGTRSSRVENKLSSLESLLAQLWPQLANDFVNLDSQSVRKGISLFLSVQFLRHPELFNMTEKVHNQLIEAIKQLPLDSKGYPKCDSIQIGSNMHSVDTSDWLEFYNANRDQQVKQWTDTIEHDATYYAEILMKKRWSVVCIDEPLFVTSDYPLFVINPELNRNQIANENAMIMFPLSPTRILCIDNLDEPRNQYYHLENHQADLYNYFIWINTESFMISPRTIYDVLSGIERVHFELECEMSA